MEEYDRMKLEIAQLHDKNLILQKDISELLDGKTLLQKNVANITGENAALKEKIEEMGIAIEYLQSSEKEIKGLVEKLTLKIQAGVDPELKDQINKLEKLYGQSQIEIENLVERLNTLESGMKQAPVSGIFTYIENEEDQALFIEKVEEALTQEMTYAQIDEHLSKNLPLELDKIVKDHPALTKNYIRNLRRD